MPKDSLNRLRNGDLVRFRPWNLQYPGLGVIIDDDASSDDEWSGYLFSVLGPDGTIWELYRDQLTKVQDDG